jgi:hypothetical protein
MTSRVSLERNSCSTVWLFESILRQMSLLNRSTTTFMKVAFCLRESLPSESNKTNSSARLQKSADALELRITTVTHPVPIVSACYSLGAWEFVRFVPCFCTFTTKHIQNVILRQVNMKESGNSKAHTCIVDQHSKLLKSTQPAPRRSSISISAVTRHQATLCE